MLQPQGVCQPANHINRRGPLIILLNQHFNFGVPTERIHLINDHSHLQTAKGHPQHLPPLHNTSHFAESQRHQQRLHRLAARITRSQRPLQLAANFNGRIGGQIGRRPPLLHHLRHLFGKLPRPFVSHQRLAIQIANPQRLVGFAKITTRMAKIDILMSLSRCRRRSSHRRQSLAQQNRVCDEKLQFNFLHEFTFKKPQQSSICRSGCGWRFQRHLGQHHGLALAGDPNGSVSIKSNRFDLP